MKTNFTSLLKQTVKADEDKIRIVFVRPLCNCWQNICRVVFCGDFTLYLKARRTEVKSIIFLPFVSSAMAKRVLELVRCLVYQWYRNRLTKIRGV